MYDVEIQTKNKKNKRSLIYQQILRVKMIITSIFVVICFVLTFKIRSKITKFIVSNAIFCQFQYYFSHFLHFPATNTLQPHTQKFSDRP